MTAEANEVRTTVPGYRQSISGCLEGAIGQHGLTEQHIARRLNKLVAPLEALKSSLSSNTWLPLLTVCSETTDIEAAQAGLDRLSEGANTIIFFGTGGSALGGQTLAQLGGWNLPGVTCGRPHSRPRIRFYDNLDPVTLDGALSTIDLPTTRFVITSKSGGTAETLAQALCALARVKDAGLANRIPDLFLGITEPHQADKKNGLRDLLESFSIPILDHHTGIGGRFSCLTNVGLLPAMARGLDPYAVRAGANDVVNALRSAASPAALAPAIGAATITALAQERGIRTVVMMPYTDRLGRFADWFVQLWAESLGKEGLGTTPISAIGPLDQHSQLQLFMDGPRELLVTVVRTPTDGLGQVIDKDLAERAGANYLAGTPVGTVTDAQSRAVAEALTASGRPVRTIDLPALNERAVGALLMHFMIETIFTASLLGVDPFDQPAVELAKIITRERLSS